MGIFDDEDSDEARVHEAACAAADAWVAHWQSDYSDETLLGLHLALDRLQVATRSSPLRKVK